MKRCPQCEFIYPDRDELCDFDQTPLVSATESEIAAITNTPERLELADLAATDSKKFERPREWRALPIAAASGLILGLAIVAAYFTMQRLGILQTVETTTSQVTNSHNIATPSPSPAPSISSATAPELAASNETPQATPPRASTTHSTSRPALVSTGPPRTEATSSRKTVILLTTGGKIEADAAWRTKDGTWYRRNGIVTLLKGNRVRAILSQ